MCSADLKKVVKGLNIDFENPAATKLFYGAICNIYLNFLNNPFLTVQKARW